ncbi:MAG: AAA family ATPase, partial [Hyphomicrobiales bacterium]|nr:AAA family ATPase [Hyphomicrobiales bacterium]
MERSPTSSAKALQAARFSPPPAPQAAIDRARLVALVDRADVKLTLIRAPAGFGKTTLMQQLRKRYQAGGFVTVWLQVDQGDNSLAAFLQSLTGAMRAALPEAASAPAARSFAAAESPQGLAADLLERLSLAEADIALFLDDLETIVDEEVWTFLQRL